jgi:hypothetical protein
MIIDVLCLIVLGATVWCVASEGLWGSAHTFLCVLLSGLMATNYFEPVATFLDGFLGSARTYSDFVAFVGLFAAFIFALRLGTEHLSPTFIQLPSTADQVGRWVFAALTGYLTVAVLLTAIHTAPFPREFLGFKSERNNFFGMGPDRQWLGFMQYVTEKPFGWVEFQDRNFQGKDGEVPHAFDGHYEVLGETTASYHNRVWPSFPIRYATRRGQIGGVTAPAPVPIAVPVGPVSPGGSAPANPGF